MADRDQPLPPLEEGVKLQPSKTLQSNLHSASGGESIPSYKNILTKPSPSSSTPFNGIHSAQMFSLEEGELPPSPSVAEKIHTSRQSDYPNDDVRHRCAIPPGQVISDIAFQVKPITLYQGKPSITFNLQEQSKLLADLNFVLVGKFTHGRPPMSSIQKFFASLKLKGKISLSFMDKKHIFIECLCKSDFYFIWLKLQWSIQGFPMRIFKWDPEFNPSKESSTAPVWIRISNLPLYFFEAKTLLSIANVIGCPIQIDPKNVNRTDFSSARLCVELDVAKPLIDAIWISLKDDSSKVLGGFWVHVYYDFVPSFCLECSHIGHGKETCKRLFADKVLVDLPVKESQSVSTLAPKTAIRTKEKTVVSSQIWKEVKGTGTGVKDTVFKKQKNVSSINSFTALSTVSEVEVAASSVVGTSSNAVSCAPVDASNEILADFELPSGTEPCALSLCDKVQQIQPAISAQALYGPDVAVSKCPAAETAFVADKSPVSASVADVAAPGSLVTASLIISSADATPVAERASAADGTNNTVNNLSAGENRTTSTADKSTAPGCPIASTPVAEIQIFPVAEPLVFTIADENSDVNKPGADITKNPGADITENPAVAAPVAEPKASLSEETKHTHISFADFPSIAAPVQTLSTPLAAVSTHTLQIPDAADHGFPVLDSEVEAAEQPYMSADEDTSVIADQVLHQQVAVYTNTVAAPAVNAAAAPEFSAEDMKKTWGERMEAYDQQESQAAANQHKGVTNKVPSKKFHIDLPIDFDPMMSNEDDTERMSWSQLISGSIKLLARRSVSPVGRSSEKLIKLRNRVDFLDHDAGKTKGRDKEEYLKENEEFFQAKIETNRKAKGQRQSPPTSGPRRSKRNRGRNRYRCDYICEDKG